jgi:hypothetical protein
MIPLTIGYHENSAKQSNAAESRPYAVMFSPSLRRCLVLLRW